MHVQVSFLSNMEVVLRAANLAWVGVSGHSLRKGQRDVTCAARYSGLAWQCVISFVFSLLYNPDFLTCFSRPSCARVVSQAWNWHHTS